MPETRTVREQITPYDAYEHVLTTVHASGTSQYQEWVIGENPAFGRMLVLDGIVQSTEADEFIYHEGIVHPPMIAVGQPRRVLILGGGDWASAREVLRWPCVEHVDMVDIDEEVVLACREHLPRHHAHTFDDARLSVRHTDATLWLKRCVQEGATYDVIISDMTDPVESGPATFCFTREYFSDALDALSPEGVLIVQAGPVSPVEIPLHAKVIRTLAAVFPHIVTFSIDAPCYSRPLGFSMGSRVEMLPRLEAARVDAALATLPGPMRWLTPMGLMGRMAMPGYVVDAIGARDDIYTDESPADHGDASILA